MKKRASTSAAAEGTKSNKRSAVASTANVDVPGAAAVTYRKVDHREHVLLRPGMYVGSTDVDTCSAWVVDPEAQRMRQRVLNYVPALLKIFDEVLMNAVDHATRVKVMREEQEKAGVSEADRPLPVRNIRVDIDRVSGVVEVTNDGEGIDVALHEESGGQVYIPELIFGHMLTSANYEDEANAERIIGGQNGIGAKACNIFSKRFEVETVDRKRRKLYAQVFEDNMSVTRPPRITTTSVKPFTRIRFLPDYARLGSRASAEGVGEGGLTDDMYSLLEKRVYDATAVTDPTVTVHLNKKKMDCKSFERYMDYYLGPRPPASGPTDRAYERINEHWEVGAACSEDGAGLQQVSFVNGVWTMRGGKHVDHVVQQITRKLTELIHKRRSGSAVKPQFVRDNLFVFVKACIPNPTFDSQSKETLTTPVGKFGFSVSGAGGAGRIEVSERFVERLYKSALVERIVRLSEASADKSLKVSDGKKQTSVSGVPKLDDANWAGGSRSAQCTLILTEGDSAKTMAVAGLSQAARDKYGVFPLRGKVLNVCDLTPDRIANNKEVVYLKKILGLESGRTYTDASSLRYGRVMIMTDQDQDGSHIKGLLFNLFFRLWPSLLRVPGFLTSMLTPIVKARRKGQPVRQMYNMADYEAWLASEEGRGGAGWDIKYYKGLGTSTREEAKEYFRDLKTTTYAWDGDESARALELGFNKAYADERKRWLLAYDRTAGLNYADGAPPVTFHEFVARDLVHFSNYDVVRSIPSMCDGLKVSQRKILYCCFKRDLRKELKVAQLAGYVSEHAMYHHGEASLNATIVGMAQDFVGADNINMLMPVGQFGSRREGGKDSAATRYIHTFLNPLAFRVFHPDDGRVLRYQDSDGVPVEPELYVPVLPTVLVNGANGIGTGFSTNVPCHSPRDVVAALRAMLVAEDPKAAAHALPPLRPWYRGFTGGIERHGSRYFSRGVVRRTKPCEVAVTELPIGYWTDDFKEHVDALKEKLPEIKAVRHNHSDTKVSCTLVFTNAAALDAFMFREGGGDTDDNGERDDDVASSAAVSMNGGAGGAAAPRQSRLEKELKLVSNRNMSVVNMYLFNREGRIQKYDSVAHVLCDFYDLRVETYAERKRAVLRDMYARLGTLRNKSRFVQAVVDGDIVPHKHDKAGLEDTLRTTGFDADRAEGFDYIVRMPVYSLTADKKRELDDQIAELQARVDDVEQTSETDMWSRDLDAFEEAYEKSEKKGGDGGGEGQTPDS